MVDRGEGGGAPEHRLWGALSPTFACRPLTDLDRLVGRGWLAADLRPIAGPTTAWDAQMTRRARGGKTVDVDDQPETRFATRGNDRIA
jgi:hypothetical protein